MFEHIVVAYDCSDPADGAAAIAFALAASGGADVALVHVQGPGGECHETDLAKLAQRAPHGVPVKTLLLHGDAVEQLRQFLEREQVDLVVAGTRGTSGIRKALLGSVSRSLLDNAPCAVMLVRENLAGLGAGPVVVGLDYSEEARAAVAAGHQIATALAAPLLLVHVLDNHIPVERDEPSASLPAEREGPGRKLPRDVGPTVTARRPTIIYDIREGVLASEQLLRACTEHNAQLVVVGHRSKGRVISELLGSTARELADRAPCPVIIMSPTPSQAAT